ncbi:hypothetical protein [Streptomyces rimosus]|uniref:hypothetical protein n=1 Tax=Streptomyces rimosus TaxID=1927 RepID=UPI00131CDF7A|nr:hypothetical protein [Streptomyces rimosus]
MQRHARCEVFRRNDQQVRRQSALGIREPVGFRWANTAIIAIRTATSSLTGLVRQINYLNEESLFVGDLEHIQDEAERRATPTTGR